MSDDANNDANSADDGAPGWLKVVLVIGLTVLPIVLVVGTGMAMTTDRPPIWQLGLQLALFVVGASIALVVFLMLVDRAEKRGKPPPRMIRWVGLGIFFVVVLGRFVWER